MKNTDHDRNKVMTLAGEELIRRFLLHILPKGFMRIRHYGFLANRCRKHKLAQIRHYLQQDTEQDTQSADKPPDLTVTQPKTQTCPKCHSQVFRVIGEILPVRLHYGGAMTH